MKTECIIELMKEKEHIKNYEIGIGTMPIMYRIESLRGNEFAKKLFKIIKKDKGFLIQAENTPLRSFVYCRKKDIDEWLNNFKQEETMIRWSCERLDNQIKEYTLEKGFELVTKRYNEKVINLKKRNERLKKEEEKKQEAIDLLDQLI